MDPIEGSCRMDPIEGSWRGSSLGSLDRILDIDWDLGSDIGYRLGSSVLQKLYKQRLASLVRMTYVVYKIEKCKL